MGKFDLFESWRRRVEQKYHRLLSKLTRMIRLIVINAKTPQDVQKGIDRMMHSPDYDEFVQTVVGRMVTMTKVGHCKSWRQAAAKSSRGKQIYQALKEQTSHGAVALTMRQIIAENSTLIKTVPQYVAKVMSEIAEQGYMEGLRTEAIMDRMRDKAPHLTEVQLRRIARTESSKAATALTQARCEDMGLEWYVWHSCEDERVRSSHRSMEGIVCRWSDPPNPEKLFPDKKNKPKNAYHPGGIYNCRCIPLPVIDERDLSLPCKVHVRGRIVTVATIEGFRKLCVLDPNAFQEQRKVKLRVR